MGAKDSFHGIKKGSEVVAHYTAKGTEKTAVAADDAGKDIGKGTDKTAHVTVYYTEDAGKKTAHFFEKL
jgi:hypothetical protein